MNATARKLRDNGMQRATAHADNDSEGWSSLAYFFARNFVRKYDKAFTCEQVRAYAAKKGLPDPPDGRAWGGVLTRLAKDGYIAKKGYSQAVTNIAHMRPVTLWQVVE